MKLRPPCNRHIINKLSGILPLQQHPGGNIKPKPYTQQSNRDQEWCIPPAEEDDGVLLLPSMPPQFIIYISCLDKKITYDVEEEERGSTTLQTTINLCTAIQNILHNNIIRKDRGWYHNIEKRSDHYILVCILKYIMSAVGSGSFLVVDTSTDTAKILYKRAV